MLWAFLCQRLPWHHWVIEKQLSGAGRKLTCSCGRQYAVHDGMGVILPWDSDFEKFYAENDEILRMGR